LIIFHHKLKTKPNNSLFFSLIKNLTFISKLTNNCNIDLSLLSISGELQLPMESVSIFSLITIFVCCGFTIVVVRRCCKGRRNDDDIGLIASVLAIAKRI